MPITTASRLEVTVKEAVTVGGKTKIDQLELRSDARWKNSSGVLGITKQFNDRRTLNNTNENLDLAGGVSNVFGTVAFVKIKMWGLQNVGTGNIKAGGAAPNAWAGLLNSTGVLTLPPGAVHYFECPDANGWPVVAGTGDILKMESSHADGAHEILLEGE